MQLQIEQCLELPSLHEAALIAGAGGKSNAVTSVTVLEYPDLSLLTEKTVIGNELILSALAFIKDDVKAQCELIKHLSKMGEAGLIIYYTGIIIRELSQEVLDTADELNFPLIIMPVNRIDFRYSDVIVEVMEVIISERSQSHHYLRDLVLRLAHFPNEKHSINSVIKLLSDSLQCSVILTDKNYFCRSSALKEADDITDISAFLNDILNELHVKGKVNLCFWKNDIRVWNNEIISANNQRLHLIVVDSGNKLRREDLLQAAEVVELFLNIWNRNMNYEGEDDLVHAILSNQPEEKDRLAKRMHIDIDEIHTMCVLRLKDSESGMQICGEALRPYIMEIKTYLSQWHDLLIVDMYENYIVSFSDDGLEDVAEISLLSELEEIFCSRNAILDGAVCRMIKNTNMARKEYFLVISMLDGAHSNKDWRNI